MEEYTGRGLYSERGARKPPPNLQSDTQMPPIAAHAQTFTTVDIAPPRVRTVEEILEQTKVDIPSRSIYSTAPSEFEISREEAPPVPPHQPIRRSYSLESGLSSLSAMNSLLHEIDADHEKYMTINGEHPPPDALHPDDLISEINNILNP